MNEEYCDSPPKIEQLQQQQSMNNLINKTYSIKMDKANTVLSDHNLIKYELPKDVNNNLFEALSMAQFLTIDQAEDIKAQFINHVKNLITQSKVPKKLSIFSTNLSLFKDYNTNPTFTGFQKINFELASIIFQKKIIVYQIQDESQLLAHFYNNQFEPAIQLLKHGLHFDVIYGKKQFESITICKELVIEIFEKQLNISFTSQISQNQISTSTPTPIKPSELQPQSPRSPPKQIASKAFDQKSSTKHKKSMSDNFNLSNNPNETNYNLFSNLKIPDDFLQTLSSVQGNQPEPKKDYFSDMFAIQNYNVSNSKVTSPGNSMKYFDQNYGSNSNFPIHELQENDQIDYQKILNDSFTQNIFPLEDEIIQGNYEQHQDYNNSGCHSPNQLNSLEQMPNNLQNNNNNNFLFNDNLFTKKKLAINPHENEQLQPRISSPSAIGAVANQQFQFLSTPNYYMMPNQLPQQQQQQFNYYQPQQPQQQPYQSYSNRKKGPIIVDESKHRYTGKLKFFDEQKQFGFIVKDDDNSDVFLHFDDLTKAGISTEVLATIRAGNIIRFEFCCLEYMGKYNRSRKAIDLVVIAIE